VQAVFPPAMLARLRHGLALDGQPLKPAKVDWQNPEQLRFVLTEGKKRQIRRMCELVGLKVVGLKRVRIGRVMLGNLPRGPVALPGAARAVLRRAIEGVAARVGAGRILDATP
jgi:23S rRNA pseudouridine2604 synthase